MSTHRSLTLCTELLNKVREGALTMSEVADYLVELYWLLKLQEDLRNGRNARRRARRSELIAMGIKPKRYGAKRRQPVEIAPPTPEPSPEAPPSDEWWYEPSDPLFPPIHVTHPHGWQLPE